MADERFDIILELYNRNLDYIVELILSFTDGRTIDNCFAVCSAWQNNLLAFQGIFYQFVKPLRVTQGNVYHTGFQFFRTQA